jgi:hypothetical protein
MAKMLIDRVAWLEDWMEVRLKKKMANKKNVNVNNQKRLTVEQCWLLQGEEPDEDINFMLKWDMKLKST